ncbi:MAG: 16S rRNA (uracil(1498)-N(3))-methyltransferase [Streptosporangiaceae bacterium]|nr:16S rRNA (uracil(1498)-N(3))-methyltransferase [Streptosporangiaceae bacterium]
MPSGGVGGGRGGGPPRAGELRGLPPRQAQPPVFFTGRAGLRRDVIVLAGAEGRHAAAARRLVPGERVDVADGAGLIAECVVAGPGRGGLELTVRTRRQLPRPEPLLTVVQAIPKGDRGELAVAELTEVGVDRIVPWAAARCVAVWHGERGLRSLAKWRVTAREAAKQSRRAWIPEVTDVASAAGVAEAVAKAVRAVVLDPDAPDRLAALRPPASGDLIVIVGPEGGITSAESTAFLAAGATARRLGPTVLRTSTAGTAAAAVLLSRTARWLPGHGDSAEWSGPDTVLLAPLLPGDDNPDDEPAPPGDDVDPDDDGGPVDGEPAVVEEAEGVGELGEPLGDGVGVGELLVVGVPVEADVAGLVAGCTPVAVPAERAAWLVQPLFAAVPRATLRSVFAMAAAAPLLFVLEEADGVAPWLEDVADGDVADGDVADGDVPVLAVVVSARDEPDGHEAAGAGLVWPPTVVCEVTVPAPPVA